MLLSASYKAVQECVEESEDCMLLLVLLMILLLNCASAATATAANCGVPCICPLLVFIDEATVSTTVDNQDAAACIAYAGQALVSGGVITPA